MKEQFIEKRFNEQDAKLIDLCDQILDGFMRQGYQVSLRQLYYQLVTMNVIPNHVAWYEKLGTLINDARLAGLIDWEAIVDRGRELHQRACWDSPQSAVDYVADRFFLNMWAKQPYYIEVMVEKQALEGVLIPVCDRWGIGFTANKGYSSVSALYECSKRLLNAIQRGKTPVVLYLGDHDPSGIDMTRDLRDRLSLLCRGTVDVKRLALNLNGQVIPYKLPPNPAKLSDSRAKAYIAKFGDESWELDALPPKVLDSLVHKAVERRVDPAQWATDQRRQKMAIAILRDASRKVAATWEEQTLQAERPDEKAVEDEPESPETPEPKDT